MTFLKSFWTYHKQKTSTKVSKLWIGAKDIINGIRVKKFSSKYSHDNNVDTIKGSYEVDCSGFVNNILVTQKLIKSLVEIQNFVESQRDIPKPKNLQPWPLHYVLFLNSQIPKKFWNSIKDARLLEPGDIIAYTSFKKKNPGSEHGQHIMIVADAIKITPASPWIWVPIFDSTKKPHGPLDNRGIDGGIEQSTIGLEVDKSGVPEQLKWYQDSKFSLRRNIVMARLTENSD